MPGTPGSGKKAIETMRRRLGEAEYRRRLIERSRKGGQRSKRKKVQAPE